MQDDARAGAHSWLLFARADGRLVTLPFSR
jgi:hypothetical protein